MSRQSWLTLSGLLVLLFGLLQHFSLPKPECELTGDASSACGARIQAYQLAQSFDEDSFCTRLAPLLPEQTEAAGGSNLCVSLLGRDDRAALWRSLFWDNFLLLAYGCFGFWLFWRSPETSSDGTQDSTERSGKPRPGRVAALLMPAAAGFDLVENALLWQVLDSVDPTFPWLMPWAATAKLILLAVAGLFALPLVWTLLRRRIEAMRQGADSGPQDVSLLTVWRAMRTAGSLLVLIRVPLLIVAIGWTITKHVAQVSELFDLSIMNGMWAWMSLTASGVLGLLVWYSARTLYAFRWPHLPPAHEWVRVGTVLPRVLGALVPLTMMVGFATRPALDAPTTFYWAYLYAIQAGIVLLLTTYRRPMIRWASGTRALGAVVVRLWRVDGASMLPDVGTMGRWKELSTAARWIHALGLPVLFVAILIGAAEPRFFDELGPQALILFAACWTVWASTLPVYLATTQSFPLISSLFVLALVMSQIPEPFRPVAAILVIATATALLCSKAWSLPTVPVALLATVVLTVTVYVNGPSRLHAVRLSGNQSSLELPEAELHYSDVGRWSMENYVNKWLSSRDIQTCPHIYLISSEGGGIRAAMWTAVVLENIQTQSQQTMVPPRQTFWHCTLAASGVSGGSLGLTMFAASVRDQLMTDLPESGDMASKALSHDFLAPVLGRMFGTDPLEALTPLGLFTDRGQALEDRWRQRYHEALENALGPSANDRSHTGPNSFHGSLPQLIEHPSDNCKHCLLPALLLNTTVVHTGQRLVQHPFAPINPSMPNGPVFKGAVDGATWLPAELPVSSAALNSARFTFVSPVGSVYKRGAPSDRGAEHNNAKYQLLGQLADGGYFENSGTLTLREFLEASFTDEATMARIRIIHISNDPGVEPMMVDAADQCTKRSTVKSVSARGGLFAPPLALLKAREARGQQAREALAHKYRGQLTHFRLCAGAHPLPLGWTLSNASIVEMRQQLACSAEAKNLTKQCDSLLDGVLKP